MKSLLSFVLILPLLATAESGNHSEKRSLSGPDFYTLENICSTGSQFILYPGAAYRSFVDRQYIHQSFEDLLMAVSKLSAGIKVSYGCNAGANRLASPEEIDKRLSALRAACLKAKLVLIAE